METNTRTRVLLVDDEPHLLEGLTRILRRQFDVATAVGGAAGLERMQQDGPFAVVVSDLRMPGMDGVAFLSQVRQHAPDTVRILLTGQADLGSAIDAVNQGAVFRFMTKPAAPEALQQALSAAEAQYRLITAERVLLEETLQGSIKALTDIMALVNPAAFGRAGRAKKQVEQIAAYMGLKSRWQLEVAAMLSQIGSVTLPAGTVQKLYQGEQMTHAETVTVERLPQVAADVIASIPRLEGVQEILTHQNRRYDGVGSPPGTPREKSLPLGSRVLKIVLDLDVLETNGMPIAVALDTLRSRTGCYDPDILQAFADMIGQATQQRVVQVELQTVRPGMVFAEDVKSPNGILLIARGQEVSDRLVERIHNLLLPTAAKQRVHMIVSMPAGTEAPEPEPGAVMAGA